jgi:hypothetical protein
MKKVLLVIIDAWSSRVVIPAMQKGKLPNLAALARAGILHPECIAVFPSITPAATSSIVTGVYPCEHGIPGMYWYDEEKDSVVYYGYDIWAVIARGIGTFIGDFLVRLNRDYLKAPTLFQMVENSGRQAASLNYVVFHGDVPHAFNVQLLLNFLPGAPAPETLTGPTITYFGDFVTSELPGTGERLSSTGGPFNKFGFVDQSTGDLLVQLAEKDAMPDFTMAYFFETDAVSHKVGPQEALKQVQYVDKRLGEFIESFGGVDRLLEEICVVVTGDHSQSDVVESRKRPGISLHELLADFNVAQSGTPMDDGDELVACPNLRTVQIYLNNPTQAEMNRLIGNLVIDERVDQIIWRADLLDPPGQNNRQRGYRVHTHKRGDLHFWAGDDGPNRAVDRHGGVWSWEGGLATVDAVIVDGTLTFESYPNAFERIAGILELPLSGHVWVTARPGYEFCLDDADIHPGGGSHASLHVLDSLSPLIVAGAPPDLVLPDQLRTVDIAPLILTLLGIKPETPMGASHLGRWFGER